MNVGLNCVGPPIYGFFFSINTCYIVCSWLNLQMREPGYRGLAVNLYLDF